MIEVDPDDLPGWPTSCWSGMVGRIIDTGGCSPQLAHYLRQRVAGLLDGRCVRVDDDGCRCMRRPNGHGGTCDFPWTPYFVQAAHGRDILLLGERTS